MKSETEEKLEIEVAEDPDEPSEVYTEDKGPLEEAEGAHRKGSLTQATRAGELRPRPSQKSPAIFSPTLSRVQFTESASGAVS